jgi:hypothetical protein
MRDLEARVDALASLVPTGNRTATANGTGIDLQGYDGALVVINADTITDGTHTPKVQESDDNSSFSDVASTDLVGTALVAITAASVQRIAYVGIKRYIRVVVTVTGSPATGGKYNALVMRGLPSRGPL